MKMRMSTPLCLLDDFQASSVYLIRNCDMATCLTESLQASCWPLHLIFLKLFIGMGRLWILGLPGSFNKKVKVKKEWLCAEEGGKACRSCILHEMKHGRMTSKKLWRFHSLWLSLVVFSHQGACGAGAPVMKWKGMLGFMCWTKWLQVEFHDITDLYKSLPWGSNIPAADRKMKKHHSPFPLWHFLLRHSLSPLSRQFGHSKSILIPSISYKQ